MVGKLKHFLIWILVKTKWHRLRAVGNSAPVRLTIIIPLVGYFILFNENFLKYLELSRTLFGMHTDIGDAPHLPPFRLLLIYFGLCLIASASALYSLYCPREIKKYGAVEEYIGGDGQNLSIKELGKISRRLNRVRRDDDATRALANFIRTIGQSTDYNWIKNTRDQASEIEVSATHLYFDVLNESYPVVRVVTAVLYSLGFATLIIPSFEVFIRVSRIMIRIISLYIA